MEESSDYWVRARLKREYEQLQRDPPAGIAVKLVKDDLYLWSFVLIGLDNTPYEGGVYYGELRFTADYPSVPPHIIMLTPNGRFKLGESICLSVSPFHPQNWNQRWTIGTYLNSFFNYMMNDTDSSRRSDEEKRAFAAKSMQHNRAMPSFVEAFGEEFFITKPGETTNGGVTATTNAKTTVTVSTQTEEEEEEEDDDEESELSSYRASDDEMLDLMYKRAAAKRSEMPELML